MRRVGLAAVVVGAYLTTQLSGASFVTITSNGSDSFGSTSLVAPGSPACAWTGSNSLNVTWSNTNGTTASGHQVDRSNTSGSGFTSLGTTSPASVTLLGDANPAPPTLRYYRVTATVGSWTSAATAEVVSNTCAKSIVAFAGGGASTACSYTGAATGLSLNFLTAASLGSPSSSAALATDSSGNLYVADTQNNCVRKIDPAGNVTSVAGGGATATCGTTTATSVKLTNPQGVTVDSSGNVYVADTGNNCVRKIAGTTVTRYAGGGATSTCGSTTAANVSLNGPTGIEVDPSGNLYVGDNGNRCVRKIDTGGNVTAFMGNGTNGTNCSNTGTTATSAPLRMIDQITADGSGNVYIADGGYSCIYKVNGGTITRIAGSTSGTQTGCTSGIDPSTAGYSAAYPAGVAVDGSGNVFYTLAQDSDVLHRACVIKLSGTTPTRVAGSNGTGSSGNNGPAIAALLNAPTSLALAPSGDLYVSDISNQTIQRIITP